MLEHQDSVAASSLTIEDLTRFDYRCVTTSKLFAGCVLHETNKSKMDDIENKIERHIKLYAHVVPYPVIQEKCQEVERGLMADKGAQICVKKSFRH